MISRKKYPKALIERAEELFVRSVPRLSWAELAKMTKIPGSTLRRYARQMDWYSKRNKHFQRLNRAAVAAEAKGWNKDKEIEDLLAIANGIKEALRVEKQDEIQVFRVKPSNYEKMVEALVKLESLLSLWAGEPTERVESIEKTEEMTDDELKRAINREIEELVGEAEKIKSSLGGVEDQEVPD